MTRPIFHNFLFCIVGTIALPFLTHTSHHFHACYSLHPRIPLYSPDINILNAFSFLMSIPLHSILSVVFLAEGLEIDSRKAFSFLQMWPVLFRLVYFGKYIIIFINVCA